MHRATLHDYITRTANRLLQPALRVRIGWIIGLGRRYEHHRARQKYIVVSGAGSVLGRASVFSKLRPQEGALVKRTMGALAPGGTSLNLMFAPWGRLIPPPGIGFTVMSDPALDVGTRSWVKTARRNHAPSSSETRGTSSVTTSTAGSEFSTLLRPSGTARLEVTMRRGAGRELMAFSLGSTRVFCLSRYCRRFVLQKFRPWNFHCV